MNGYLTSVVLPDQGVTLYECGVCWSLVEGGSTKLHMEWHIEQARELDFDTLVGRLRAAFKLRKKAR